MSPYVYMSPWKKRFHWDANRLRYQRFVVNDWTGWTRGDRNEEEEKKKLWKSKKEWRKKQHFIQSIRIIFQHIMFCPIWCCCHGVRYLFVKNFRFSCSFIFVKRILFWTEVSLVYVLVNFRHFKYLVWSQWPSFLKLNVTIEFDVITWPSDLAIYITQLNGKEWALLVINHKGINKLKTNQPSIYSLSATITYF